jgi:tripartite-type tricarboxylate transporter receptor subunit TctC
LITKRDLCADLTAQVFRSLADALPTRPVRLTVPLAAGGSGDIVARPIGQWLSERLGQSFITTWPAARQRPRPDAENFGGEVSF